MLRAAFFLLILSGLAAVPSSRALDKTDIEYSRPDGKPLLLDVHIPDGKGPFPAAIIVHGGGFDAGTKQWPSIGPVMDVLGKAAFVCISIDYRLAPAVRFPAPAEDLDNAIRWVKKNAATYSVDPAKIILVGESAGAYFVAYAGTHETPETRVAAVVDFYGPIDYERLALLRRDHPELFDMKSLNQHAADGGGIHFFGVDTLDAAGLARLRQISPINAVHPGMPPFLILHGTADNQVAYEESPAMCDAIHKVGVQCDLITIEGGGHGMRPWDRSEAMQHWKPEIVVWLRKTLSLPQP